MFSFQGLLWKFSLEALLPGYSPPTSGFGWDLGGRILADRINQKSQQR
jgi:hypothetical protein